MPVIKIVPTQAKKKRKMKSIIDYVAKDNAVLFYKPGTEKELSYLHPDSLKDITDHQELIKQAYDKTDGKQYFHIISSFSPDDDVTEFGLKNYAEKMLKDDYFKGYDTIVALHQDTDHKHLHFIVNSVNTLDGKKLDNRITDLYHLRQISDRNALMSMQIAPLRGKSKKQGTTYNSKAYNAIKRGSDPESDYESMIVRISEAIKDNADIAVNQQDFIDLMKNEDIEVTWTPKRKHVVFKDMKSDSKKNKIRLNTLNNHMNTNHDKDTLLNQFEQNHQLQLRAHQKYLEIQEKIKRENEKEKELQKQKAPKKSPPKMPVEHFNEIRDTKPLEPIKKPLKKAPVEPESNKGGSTIQRNTKALEKHKKDPFKEPEKDKTEVKPEVKPEKKRMSREEHLARAARIASVVEGYNDYDNDYDNEFNF